MLHWKYTDIHLQVMDLHHITPSRSLPSTNTKTHVLKLYSSDTTGDLKTVTKCTLSGFNIKDLVKMPKNVCADQERRRETLHDR